MLETLVAANEAFELIKVTVQNGKEIYEAGEALARYFGLKEELQKRAHQHGYKSDIQAFMAAEQLAAKEAELKEMMIYQGRGGMWDDWLAFQSEMKRSREAEKKEQDIAKMKRRKFILDFISWSGFSIAIVLLISASIYLTLAILKYN